MSEVHCMPMKIEIAAVALAAALLCSGCAVAPMKPAQEPSLYERLGGNGAITAVVDDAIGNISTDARINRRFVNAGSGLTKNLVDLI
jgi:hemoglobin